MKHPPERIQLAHPDSIELRRALVSDAELIAEAVWESIPHLDRFMPWAREPQSWHEDFQRERLEGLEQSWERAEEFQYIVCPTGTTDKFLGVVGLMTRLGPGSLEFGYWVHTDHEGKGYIRAACSALSEVAFTLEGIDVLYICCDPENVRSMAIPRALGYVDEGTFNGHPVCGTSRMFSKRRTL